MNLLVTGAIAFPPAVLLWGNGGMWTLVAVLTGVVHFGATFIMQGYIRMGVGGAAPEGVKVAGGVSLIVLVGLFILGIVK